MANPRDIRFDQRNATNTAYIETYVSGSNLIVRTNDVGVVVGASTIEGIDRKSTRLNSSHIPLSRMPSSA